MGFVRDLEQVTKRRQQQESLCREEMDKDPKWETVLSGGFSQPATINLLVGELGRQKTRQGLTSG